MTEKEKEQKLFDPIEKAIGDAWHVGFFGDRSWDYGRFGGLCRMRGLVGSEIWSHQALSAPLRLLVQATRDLEEDRLNAALHDFAVNLNLDENAVRRHFWAIRFQVEEQFLAAVKLAEEKRRKLERLAEEAEIAPEPEGPIETGEEEEE
ncbi:MAG: hypothetical protein NWE99_01215 [Candidatus Bathyarchaeota archaeon]|nr:hypothetical protein [Candidatus Bathyarchaeota archaeon]